MVKRPSGTRGAGERGGDGAPPTLAERAVMGRRQLAPEAAEARRALDIADIPEIKGETPFNFRRVTAKLRPPERDDVKAAAPRPALPRDDADNDRANPANSGETQLYQIVGINREKWEYGQAAHKSLVEAGFPGDLVYEIFGDVAVVNRGDDVAALWKKTRETLDRDHGHYRKTVVTGEIDFSEQVLKPVELLDSTGNNPPQQTPNTIGEGETMTPDQQEAIKLIRNDPASATQYLAMREAGDGRGQWLRDDEQVSIIESSNIAKRREDAFAAAKKLTEHSPSTSTKGEATAPEKRGRGRPRSGVADAVEVELLQRPARTIDDPKARARALNTLAQRRRRERNASNG
jgi:hypothetical protein